MHPFSPFPPPTPPPGVPPPPRSRDDSADLPGAKDPSISTTLRGLGKISWLVVPVVSWLVALQLQVVKLDGVVANNASTITIMRSEIASKASAADLQRVEGDVRNQSARQELREEKLSAKLDAMSGTLERLCARVQCGRGER